jgi:hypothetical protein
MDNHEGSESSGWVSACADLLAPPADWDPDIRLARARFEVRADARAQLRSRSRRYLLAGAVTALVAAIAVPAIPQTNALAQQAFNNGWQRLEQVWYWLTIVRRGPVLMRRLPEAVQAIHVRQTGMPEGVPRADFTPRLPVAGALSTEPALSVLGPLSFAAEWEGATLELQIGTTVTARWADVWDGREEWAELTLVQGKAEVMAPPGFDRTAFAAAALQTAGMRNPDTIRQLAGQPTTLPALLFGYRSTHRFIGGLDLPLRAGFVTMVEEGESVAETPRIGRLTLLWSGTDRMYMLSGVPKTPPAMLGVDMAVAISGALGVVYATAPPTGGAPPHQTLYRVPPGNR